MKLYRVMKVDPTDGRPLVGIRRNMLGVRPTDPNSRNARQKFDVDAVNGNDPVLPGKRKGLSVVLAAEERRVVPNEAVWWIESESLTAYGIAAMADPPPNNPDGTHHVLEPLHAITLDQYQAALVATRDLWEQVPKG